jgi:hypothetical protein
LYVFGQQTKIQMVLDYVVVSITGIQFRPESNFVFCYCHSQICELCHNFKTSVSFIYVMILLWIQVMRQQLLSFLCVYF